jgi:integrative and conjugative element protein (TIGR02256 family)
VTDGPDLAERQLRALAAVSSGAVEVLATQDTGAGDRLLMISMDTSGLPTGPGIKVRDRERFWILAGAKYPYRPPAVWVPHRRWAASSHVQWGGSLCLYAAPSVEWAPSDGMDGFIERLSMWVARAAEGTLDPDGQPLHPPVAYPTTGAGVVVVHPDISDRAPWAAGKASSAARGEAQVASVVAWCAVHGDRVDVLEWTDWLGAYGRVLADGFSPFHEGRPVVVMPALLLGSEIGFEYPDKAWDLATALEEAGFSLNDILAALANAITVNRVLRITQVQADPDAAGHPIGASHDDGHSDSGTPLLTALLLGTPSRRVGVVRLTHLAAWNLGSIGALLAGAYADFRRKPDQDELLAKVGEVTLDWLREADVTWMRILENRPEITRRRDEGTPSGWLADKRVLVLGCGALGAPAAEACARADASALHLVDNGLVTPGILVRQPYDDADVGRPKTLALAARLARIGAGLTAEGLHGNALDTLLQPGADMSKFDLVIDATADAGVRSAIEGKRRADDGRWPPLVTMIIGHDATRGLVTVSTPGSTGAGGSALRQVALHALASPGEWADIADDFFPAQPRTEMFFPEPGCSAPTFTGGYAQTAALAGLLLNEALLVLGEHAGPAAAGCTAGFASAVRIGAAAAARGTSRTRWGPEVIAVDDSFGYEVRLSPAAVTEMRTEARRGTRVRGPRIETGGMLLGAIDDAAGVIHVDRVTGPPPDSFLSAAYFQHGSAGTQEAVSVRLTASRAMTGFVGYWHTHPGGAAAPSLTDKEGMASIVAPDGRRQRALMVILGGPADQWDRWVAGEEADLAVFARLVPRGDTADDSAEGVLLTQELPRGPFFRGGFSESAPVSGKAGQGQSAAASHMKGGWWPWRRQ